MVPSLMLLVEVNSHAKEFMLKLVRAYTTLRVGWINDGISKMTIQLTHIQRFSVC
jgi:hypothetical protein